MRDSLDVNADNSAPATEPVTVLDDLERTLRDQLVSLGKGHSRGLEGRLRQMAVMVEAARKTPPDILRRKREQLAKIRQLHQQLLLTLRQQREECRATRNRVHGGKRALRAYGQ